MQPATSDSEEFVRVLAFFAILIPFHVALAGGDPERDLNQLLACHDAAVGGPILRGWDGVAYDLEIKEPGFTVQGRYTAWRSGAMRIDVFAGEQRVYSEWLEDGRAFEQPQGAAEGVAAGDEAAAILRRGIEQPGHLWTLADMRANGHHLDWASAPATAPGDAGALHLTLQDGFELWLWLDPDGCQILRQRTWSALHPAVDSTRRWVETRYADFETHDGVTKAMRVVTLDVATGDTLGETRLRRILPMFAPQAADDREGVRRAVLDYVEGFYEGDTAKLVRSVHPDVQKYGFMARGDGDYRGIAMPWSEFLAYANNVRQRGAPTPADAPKHITLFDVKEQTASARLDAWWGSDYLLLAKYEGRWMVRMVLWQGLRRASGGNR